MRWLSTPVIKYGASKGSQHARASAFEYEVRFPFGPFVSKPSPLPSRRIILSLPAETLSHPETVSNGVESRDDLDARRRHRNSNAQHARLLRVQIVWGC